MVWEQLGGGGRRLPERASRGSLVLGLALLAAMVATFWIVLNRPTREDKSIVEVHGATASATLAVTVAHSHCGNGGPRVHIDEQTRQYVALSADHDVRGDCDDIGMRTTVEVELDEPLGARSIDVALHRAHGGLTCIIDGKPSDICT